MNAVFAAELVCASEVIRIAIGNMRGDLMLAADVHYTRLLMMFMMFTTMPHPAVSAFMQQLILLVWAATEVTRYPMVLFPDNKPLRLLRYATPLITFPLGAGGEAWVLVRSNKLYAVSPSAPPRTSTRSANPGRPVSDGPPAEVFPDRLDGLLASIRPD